MSMYCRDPPQRNDRDDHDDDDRDDDGGGIGSHVFMHVTCWMTCLTTQPHKPTTGPSHPEICIGGLGWRQNLRIVKVLARQADFDQCIPTMRIGYLLKSP